MSEQPLFDIEVLRKIDAQPGDVFVLELPAEYCAPTDHEAARISEQIRSVLGDVKVMVLPPGMRLKKLPNGLRLTNTTDAPQSVAVQWHGNMPSVVRVEEPAPSLKEANEQHAVETAEAVTLIAKPSMRYLRPLSTGVLQGSNDRETWVDLDPTTMEPVQPQADEPVVIERKDGA